MSVQKIIIWLQDRFINRPILSITGTLLLVYITQAIANSTTFANIILILIWALVTIEVYRAFPKIITSTRRLATTVCVSLLIGLLLYFLFLQREPYFSINYLSSDLNGKEVTIAKSIDPSRRQLEIFVDPNYPSNFSIVGISARNEGNVPLVPDMAYLSMAGHIDRFQPNASIWSPSPDRNIEGWTTFQTTFGVMSISPKHPLNIPDFTGTPIPKTATTIRLTLVYGSSETSATFTLKP